MPTVRYSKPVSDEHVRTILQKIADFYGKDVNVTSGDRNSNPRGSSNRSLHRAHRAADFHVAGMSDAAVFAALKRDISNIFDSTQGYEVIHHGRYTSTFREHMHVGHYPSKNAGLVIFKTEGLTPATSGHYAPEPLRIEGGSSSGQTRVLPPAATTRPPTRDGSPARIRSAVGRGGSNAHNDVSMVQVLLNRARRRFYSANMGASCYNVLKEDGICGPKTKRAISLFQKHVAGFRQPDERVDPGGRTLRMLNAANTGAVVSLPTRVQQSRQTEEARMTKAVANANASAEQLVDDPRVRAMLEVLSFTEGTGNDYGKVVNGTVIRSDIYPEYIGKRNVSITNFSRHPQIYVRWANGQPPSSAAGRYQFLYKTWATLGMSDFSARSQDIAAVKLMKARNMIPALLSGDLDRAVFNGAPEWASLPKNASNQGYYSGQSARTLAQIKSRYQEALARL